MRVAIVGGTGTLGQRVVQEIRQRGHEVRILSRRTPEFRVDLTTGEGLRRALSGCDTIIDASNNSSKSAAATLVDGSKRLLATAQEVGVNHHVCVSIVGCDLVPVRYFRVKCEQERTVEQGSVPWSIVRATQFHELVATRLNSLGSWGVLPLPRAKLQPVASVEAARAVAEVAEAAPLRRRINVAGPEVSDLRDLARTWRSHTGRRAFVLPVPLPGALGRALRSGGLTCEKPDVRGTISFGGWLTATMRLS